MFSAAARLVRSGRRSTVQLARHGVWTGLITAGITRLRELAAPG
ncbi:MAG: transposase [Actinomycetota bacterium]|nr:transposase [Actinomycetota bacterium]